jgi:hypothetical protein
VLSGAGAKVAPGFFQRPDRGSLILQSTGDLGFIDVAADLSGIANQGLVPVLNGQGAERHRAPRRDRLFRRSGGSSVTFVNIATNQFIGQVL